jgi:hypothetical protein
MPVIVEFVDDGHLGDVGLHHPVDFIIGLIARRRSLGVRGLSAESAKVMGSIIAHEGQMGHW